MTEREQAVKAEIASVAKMNQDLARMLDTHVQTKMDKMDFRNLEAIHIREIEKVKNGFKDILNRLVDNETYMEKYLPYNLFVQYTELLHFALDDKTVRKFRDYEKAKTQIYLATIIQDFNARKDKRWVENPPMVRNCDCALGSFKNILYKATKLNERNRQVLTQI